MSKIAIILGTRPEIIKLYPVIQQLQTSSHKCILIHTNQHYSENMDKYFFDQLKLPRPDYNLHVGSGSHGEQTGKMLIRIEEALKESKPDVVLVQGDTNSAMAGALAARKLHMQVGHIEAGLRSYDERMPEEWNRRIIDHISDYLFVPTTAQADILTEEGISVDKVHTVGNTIVDSVYALKDKPTKILNSFNLANKDYLFMTIHRPENVDSRDDFTKLVEQINTLEYPIYIPMHPRTKKMMDKFGLVFNSNVNVLDPLNYLDTLTLMNNALCILTDSGGIQEEACILGVPCITLRRSTERPETLTVGANKLWNPDDLKQDLNMMRAINRDWKNPFGDGKAAMRIIGVIDYGNY